MIETHFSRFLDAAPDAMVIVDARGRILLLNAQTERLFGFTREELVGRPVEVLVPERFHTAHRGHRAGYLAQPSARPMGAGLELYGRRKDGSEFPVEISLSPLATEDGTLTLSAIRDITERKAAEAERERLRRDSAAQAETSRVRDEFLTTLSHELRTPLNAILGWTVMLRGQRVPPERVDHALQTIERNARAQVQLIEDLLDISRVISGKLRLRRRAVDLAEVVSAALDVMRPAAEAKGIELVATRPDHVTVVGDPDRLQQVVWNLLSNAVKFTPERGQVMLTLSATEGHARLEVRDTGQGIGAHFLPHVFDRFRQADSSATRVQGGLGLGLSIVRQLVELHGGTVTAESEGPGTGARFTVVLPRGRVAPAIAEPGAYHHDRGFSDLDGLRVLLVDDRRDERDLFATVLEQAGADVATAASGEEAFDAVRAGRFDALVTDIAMPDEDGHQLLGRIRALGGTAGEVRAVAVTAHARADDRARALAAGFDAYVAKPVDPVRLVETIALVVRRGGA